MKNYSFFVVKKSELINSSQWYLYVCKFIRFHSIWLLPDGNLNFHRCVCACVCMCVQKKEVFGLFTLKWYRYRNWVVSRLSSIELIWNVNDTANTESGSSVSIWVSCFRGCCRCRCRRRKKIALNFKRFLWRFFFISMNKFNQQYSEFSRH